MLSQSYTRHFFRTSHLDVRRQMGEDRQQSTDYGPLKIELYHCRPLTEGKIVCCYRSTGPSIEDCITVDRRPWTVDYHLHKPLVDSF
jgi:hypothetical protein